MSFKVDLSMRRPVSESRWQSSATGTMVPLQQITDEPASRPWKYLADELEASAVMAWEVTSMGAHDQACCSILYRLQAVSSHTAMSCSSPDDTRQMPGQVSCATVCGLLVGVSVGGSRRDRRQWRVPPTTSCGCWRLWDYELRWQHVPNTVTSRQMILSSSWANKPRAEPLTRSTDACSPQPSADIGNTCSKVVDCEWECPQPDTSSHCENMNMGLVHWRCVCQLPSP